MYEEYVLYHMRSVVCRVSSLESGALYCGRVPYGFISFESARTLSRINLGRKHETGLANCVLLFPFLLSLNEDEGRPILGTPIHYKRQQRSRAGGPGPRKMRANTTHQAAASQPHTLARHWPVRGRAACPCVCVCARCVTVHVAHSTKECGKLEHEIM